MAKLLGVTGGRPLQAAAGLTDQIQTPVGALVATGLGVTGWIVGSAVGHSVKEGVALFEVEPSGKDPSDFEEWISVVGAYGALVMTGGMVKQLGEEYGWQKVLGYSALYLGAVFTIKTIKDRME